MDDLITDADAAKLDALARQVAAMGEDVRSLTLTVRLVAWLCGLAVMPSAYAGYYLVTQVATMSVGLKAVNARLDRMETTFSNDLRGTRERVIRLEAAAGKP